MSHIRWSERRGADHQSRRPVASSPLPAAKTPYPPSFRVAMLRSVPTVLRRLQPRHRKLLQLVYDPFRATGKWPTARSILLAIRHDGDLGDLCRELGPEFLFCNLGDDPGATCELRVRALSHIDGAEQERQNVMVAILYLQ